MDKLVSVILPTYNVEKYLQACLDSVCSQTYSNIEIIVVIDGATDDSYNIALNYSQKDKRIKVFWQENAGSGPARNTGLHNSTGEYIVFVDPDDYIGANMICDFVKLMDKYDTDLLLSKSTDVIFSNDGTELYRAEKKVDDALISGVPAVREAFIKLTKNGLVSSPTAKMYKRELIDKFKLEFPDLRRSQDIVFNYNYYEHISSLYISEKHDYYYRKKLSEINMRVPKDYYVTALRIYRDIKDMYCRWGKELTQSEQTELSNEFLQKISRNLESNIVKRESLSDIMNSQDVKDIVTMAFPEKKYLKAEKRFFLNGNRRILVGMIRCKRLCRTARACMKTVQYRMKSNLV